MKLFFRVLLLGVLFTNISYSQRYGNEWINYNSKYVKIQVKADGIYRISYTDLSAISQISLTGLNPKNARLFHRGVEIPIKVVGENDNTWNSGDYVEFFGAANNGEQDRFMYTNQNANIRLNPYYSLYSDVTNYFLEVDNTIAGRRIADGPITQSSISNEPYCSRIIQQNYNSSWTHDPGWTDGTAILQSNFEQHEGVGGPRFRYDLAASANRIFKNTITLTNYFNGTTASNDGIHVDLKAVFMHNLATRTVVGHIGGLPINESVTGLVSRVFSRDVPTLTSGNTIADSLTITNTNSQLRVLSTTNNQNYDLFVITYQRTKYPANFNFINNSSLFISPNANGFSKFLIPNMSGVLLAYDITDPYNPLAVTISQNGADKEVFLVNNNTSRKIFTSNAPSVSPSITYKKFNTVQFSNFDYLMVTHPNLEPSVTEYANYRNSAVGGNYKVFKAYVPDIYDEFGYGERNPYGIRRMVDYWVTNGSLRYMLLLGAGSNIPNRLRDHENTLDLVPSMGYPGADILFSDNMGGFPKHAPAIPTGRIHAKTNTDVTNYLNKLKEHELLTSRPYQKKMIYISGAINQSELDNSNYVSTLNPLKAGAINSPFAAFADSSFLFVKSSQDILSPNNPDRLSLPSSFYTQLNKGTGMITYFGHGNSGFTAYDLTLASTNSSINNKGKYPFVYVNGCDVLNDFRGTSSISSNWLLTADKGAICFLGQAGPSWEYTDSPAMKLFFNTLFGSNISLARKNATAQMINSPIGNVVQQWMVDFAPQVTSPNYEVTQDQTVLEGDPALKVFAPVTLTLPVYLTEYTSKVVNEDVELNWEVVKEDQVQGYSIEKSLDGKRFEKIGFIPAKNLNTNESFNYNFTDTNPELNKVNYYKLSAINSDNSTAFTRTIAQLVNSEKYEVLILENPILGENIKLKFQDKTRFNKASIELTNINGQKIPVNISASNNDIIQLIPRNKLSKGLYLINISSVDGFSKTMKVLIN